MVFNLEIKMTTFFIGVAVGIYILGVLIAAFMKGMGGEGRGPSSLLWPLTFIISFWRK